MVLKTFKEVPEKPIKVQKLTIESFSKFGSIVSPDEEIKSLNTTAGANYGTAIKLRKVSKVENKFEESPNNATKPSQANLNIFRCFPPYHLMESLPTPAKKKGFLYRGKVLERHPYSSQTFIPMGRDHTKIGYIVVCALNNPNDSSKLPDPNTIEAFYCMANQAVTYGAGTWHAPMIAVLQHLGETVGEHAKAGDYIDFAVLINENEVDDDDCQECYFEPGFTLHFEF